MLTSGCGNCCLDGDIDSYFLAAFFLGEEDDFLPLFFTFILDFYTFCDSSYDSEEHYEAYFYFGKCVAVLAYLFSRDS